MKPLRTLALMIATTLLVLTFLLVRGTTPDANLHERMLEALRSLTLNSATLQRDVMRARAGLLRNYDPIVRSVENLHDSAGTLRAAEQIADGRERVAIRRAVETVIAGVREQEALVEVFKSQNALLQNSLSYFGTELSAATSAPESAVTGTIAALGGAMLRFTRDSGPDVAGEVSSDIDQLDRLRGDRRLGGINEFAAALVDHGRLIVDTLPVVDSVVAGLEADPTAERVRAVQGVYLAAYARTAARAGLFRVLSYLAGVALAAYVGYLFLRLRSNARILAERLRFEKLIASISTQFISLPRERIGEGIEAGLAQLGLHAGGDLARILMQDADPGRVARSYSWIRKGVPGPDAEPDDLLGIAANWNAAGDAHDHGVQAPRVATWTDGPEKAFLIRLGIRSWLSIPMVQAGQSIGFLVLATVHAEKQWLEDDIALVRTASEIFANAIARERSEIEREALEARLGHAQRLEAIGTLAGGIAHEFNNILGVMLGYGEMAIRVLRRNALAKRHVEQIMTAGARAQGVIDQILAFSRRSVHKRQPIRAQAVIAEAIEFIRASLPATVAVETHLDAEGATIMSSPTELQLVVMNLCTNAAQAMDGRGSLAIGLASVDIEGERALSHGSLPAGRYVRLSVSDTGPGIEPAIMDRLFEPFFTTKATGEGTGLGLATVHGIVTEHGGAINVESRLGAGTTFEAYFPQTSGETVAEAPRSENSAPRGDGETILLVDDERDLVLLGEEMLAAIGYEPVGFDTSSAALAAFHADPDRFDLVLTDEIMPGMTGTELAFALHEIRPDVPVILMTGYGGELRLDRQQAAGIGEVLTKPIPLEAFSRCLARHLSRP